MSEQLIRGAYAAAGGNIKNYGLAGVENIKEMQTDITKAMKPYVQADILKTQAIHKQRKQNFDEHALAYINMVGDDADHDAVWNMLQRDKRNYLYGNKKTRSKITSKMGKMKAQYDDANNLKGEIAELNLNSGLQGNAWENFKTDDIGQSIAPILSGQRKAVLNENDILGYEVEDPDARRKNKIAAEDALQKSNRLQELHGKLIENSFLEDDEAREYDDLAKGDYENAIDGFSTIINKKNNSTVFMSVYDIRSLVNKNKLDVNSRNVLATTIEFTKKQKNDGVDFNYNDYRFKIKNEVVDKGNIHSLIYDTHVPTEGGSFYADLQERLTYGTYEELGITDEDVVDPTPSTPITPEDAKVIADELIKDKAMVTDYLSSYFTNYMLNQYNLARDLQDDEENENDENNEPLSEPGTLSAFEKEFKKQRELQGPGGTFTFGGRPYTTDYKEEV
tara:strand:+ start:1306 stop:2652 length:1347 start_codon:yes stop_codon:yes gene_type:complete